MCSRFSLAEDHDFLAVRLGVSGMARANYRPRYNIGPQQDHFIVTTEYENRKLGPAKWGLVADRSKHGSALYSINAKAETVRPGQLSARRSPTGVV
jgi:putative SOS response-associated peptidase YedK